MRWRAGRSLPGVVGHLIQALTRLGEVPAFEAWVQPPGEADQLGRAVPPQSGRRVQVIAFIGPAGFSEQASLPQVSRVAARWLVVAVLRFLRNRRVIVNDLEGSGQAR